MGVTRKQSVPNFLIALIPTNSCHINGCNYILHRHPFPIGMSFQVICTQNQQKGSRIDNLIKKIPRITVQVILYFQVAGT